MELIIYIIMILFFAEMNKNQETTVIKLWQSPTDGSNKKLMKKWHFNDALVRVVLIPYGLLLVTDYNILKTLVYSINILFYYMVYFNTRWNIKMNNHLLYLGDYAITDTIIKYTITDFINLLLKKLKINRKIHYYYVYSFILLSLFILSLYLFKIV